MVVDTTSNFLTRAVEWDHVDVMFAAVQKNLGPSGLGAVIINRDVLGNKREDTPILMDWQFHEKAPNNFYNTPNVFALYLSNLVLKHTKKFGIEHYDDLAK